jgi:hypothetical protein
MTQVVECLPNKCETLSSATNTAKNKTMQKTWDVKII